MANFDTSVYLDTRRTISVKADKDALGIADIVYEHLKDKFPVTNLETGVVYADYSSFFFTRYVVCEFVDLPPESSEQNKSSESSANCRIDIKIGQRASMMADILCCVAGLLVFWFLSSWFTSRSIIFLVLVALIIGLAAYGYFTLRKKDFGISEAEAITSAIREMF